MKILKVYYAYFSPGDTTKTVVQTIADSFSDYPVEGINLASYDERKKIHNFKENDLVILGVPAYGGRVPAPVIEDMDNLHGINTPVVLVATYGNRAFDDTLMELKKNVSSRGFILVAAGAFVCQHTFLNTLGEGRPDEKDLEIIKEFGDKIKERLRLAVTYAMKDMEIPGTYPYTKPPMKGFPFKVETNEYCIYCMLCADVCPMHAISFDNPKAIDHDICLRCGACMRICPTQAKSFTEEPFKALQKNLLEPFCDTRQEPWYTIG